MARTVRPRHNRTALVGRVPFGWLDEHLQREPAPRDRSRLNPRAGVITPHRSHDRNVSECAQRRQRGKEVRQN